MLILDDSGLLRIAEHEAELGAYVHVADVAAAVRCALSADLTGHHRLTLCGPGEFDTTAARQALGMDACQKLARARPVPLIGTTASVTTAGKRAQWA